MFFKFARETLFPSPSPHLVRNQEVHILHRSLAPFPDTAISIPMTLWRFLYSTATLEAQTALCVGGHVFRIAEYFKVISPVAFADQYASSTLLHEECLIRAGFIFNEPLRWRFLKDHAITLPCDHLPPLAPNADSYLLQGSVPVYSAAPPVNPPPRRHAFSLRDRVGPSTAAEEEEDSDDDSEILTTLQRMENTLDQVVHTQAIHSSRLDHIEENFERAARPWYDFAYRSHMVGDGMPTPSWYPRHDDYYEVSLSHGFDRLRVGRRRFNNFVPPPPRAGIRIDDPMLVEGDDEGEGHVVGESEGGNDGGIDVDFD